jgi:hypothetical protein
MIRAESIGESTLIRTISDRLLSAAEGYDAADALDDLARAFDALGATLVVTAPHGGHILSVGDADVFGVPRPVGALDQIVSSVKVDEDTAVLAVRRPDGELFTGRDQRLLDRIASLFAAWLPAVLLRTPSSRNRRGAHREFEELIEQTALRTIDEGADVSALVITVNAEPLRPGLLHHWATDLRGRLRASDVAGPLSDREIGILLPGTGPVGAVAVGTRIQQRLEGNTAVIGVASRTPGLRIISPIVESAREDVARRLKELSL